MCSSTETNKERDEGEEKAGWRQQQQQCSLQSGQKEDSQPKTTTHSQQTYSTGLPLEAFPSELKTKTNNDSIFLP